MKVVIRLLYDHSRASCQTTILSHGTGTDGFAKSKIRFGRLGFLVLSVDKAGESRILLFLATGCRGMNETARVPGNSRV